MSDCRLILGDCRDVLPALPAASFDVVFTDPPYPCIKRSYGKLTEAEWFALMRAVVPECMRVLKPRGSAVFVLQPNSERVGRMRTWLWDFMAWVGREWGIVQDVWWWNHTTLPLAGANCHGLMRPSLKACVWVGAADCYRDQAAVLWGESELNLARRMSARAVAVTCPSGLSVNARVCRMSAIAKGGVTPFNVLPLPSGGCTEQKAKRGHGAGTPLALADWWLRYLCPPGGAVLDPFSGSGTAGVAALRRGLTYTGVERMPEYHAIAEKRVA